eukprot:2809163-Rhodomonas_salina.1
MNEGVPRSPGFRALAAKHGAANHMAVRRAVAKVREDPVAVANLQTIGAMMRAGELEGCGETVEVQTEQ